jgi:hypothetical protein
MQIKNVVKIDSNIVGEFLVTNNYRFGIPSLVDSLKKNNRILFFEAYNDGAIQFVTRQEKFIFTENYDPLKGKTDRYLKTTLYYAIAYNGALTFISDLGYDNIIKALPKPIKTEINKKTKLKTIKDVVSFLNQYNQVP